MKIEISAQKRATQGTGASRRLRGQGRVPGILYGGTSGPVNIELDHKELLHKLAMEAFHASILTLDIEGAKEQVLLRAFNMHPWKGRVQHVDFQRVQKDKKIHMKVPLHFKDAENSPAVKEMGAVANHVLNELDVRCFPDDLPEFIEVNLGALKVGDSVHVADLTLPKGVEAVVHRGDNPVVATMIVPALIVEEETTAADAVPAAEVPTTAQATPEEIAAAEKAGGDKAGAKGDAKPEAKGGDKADKKEKK